MLARLSTIAQCENSLDWTSLRSAVLASLIVYQYREHTKCKRLLESIILV